MLSLYFQMLLCFPSYCNCIEWSLWPCYPICFLCVCYREPVIIFWLILFAKTVFNKQFYGIIAPWWFIWRIAVTLRAVTTASLSKMLVFFFGTLKCSERDSNRRIHYSHTVMSLVTSFTQLSNAFSYLFLSIIAIYCSLWWSVSSAVFLFYLQLRCKPRVPLYEDLLCWQSF